MINYFGLLKTLGIVVLSDLILVSARLCESGQHCSPPKECCEKGCCYLYAPPSAPRNPQPDNVLNLFFINHWYFWCVIFAILLAVISACTIYKKRRQLCGWGSHTYRSQSEIDSAGSCYAPPQYSRCSSFHHAPPPPYTEVTSKPDLYPIVFSYNPDNGKSTSNYLMVQYFRNYVVHPTTLSGTSTADSISSSFMCTANDENNLVPPPYSRVESPGQELEISTRNLEIPTSTSVELHTNKQFSETVAIFHNNPIRKQFNYKNKSFDEFTINLVTENFCGKNYKSCGSIGKIVSMEIPTSQTENELRIKKNHLPSATNFNSEESRINNEIPIKFGSGISSFLDSSPGSPPRATSPTLEIKELLEQIRQLKVETISPVSEYAGPSTVRPTTLQSGNPKKRVKLYSLMKSSNELNNIPCRGKGRRVWASRSAPTTPGTLQSNQFNDHSPLLDEYDEEHEYNV